MKADPELEWLFRYSASELGYSSTMGAQLEAAKRSRLRDGVIGEWRRQQRAAGVDVALWRGGVYDKTPHNDDGNRWVNAPTGPGGIRVGDSLCIPWMSCGSTNEGLPGVDRFAACLVPGWVSGQVPSDQQVWAASRQRFLLASFRQLRTAYQAAICIAYEWRHPNRADEDDGPALQSRFGIAAHIVRCLLRHWGKTLSWADKHKGDEIAHAVMTLGESHAVWRDIRSDDRARARGAQEMARLRGQRVREDLLRRLTDDPKQAVYRERAREWLADLLQEAELQEAEA